jgi:hypothetical protein
MASGSASALSTGEHIVNYRGISHTADILFSVSGDHHQVPHWDSKWSDSESHPFAAAVGEAHLRNV